MREQLIQYVELLFAGDADSDEIRQEILQNTLDRFDDLVEQGKSPEAAYRLAISGIGDINEILGVAPKAAAAVQKQVGEPETEEDIKRKKLRAGAVALYILSAIPLIVLSELGVEIIGLALTLIMVAAATYNMVISSKKEDTEEKKTNAMKDDPVHKLKECIGEVIWIGGLIVYFVLSFSTGAWYITWLCFPIMACARGLSDAIIDLKEGR